MLIFEIDAPVFTCSDWVFTQWFTERNRNIFDCLFLFIAWVLVQQEVELWAVPLHTSKLRARAKNFLFKVKLYQTGLVHLASQVSFQDAVEKCSCRSLSVSQTNERVSELVFPAVLWLLEIYPLIFASQPQLKSRKISFVEVSMINA